MPDLIQTLEEEARLLEERLAVNRDFIKLREVNRLLALYKGDAEGRAPVAVAARAPSFAGGGPALPFPSAATGAQDPRKSALDAAAEILQGRADPTPVSEIYNAITQRGVELPGTQPKNNLSALLSRSPRFRAHGRAGWTLVSAGGDHAKEKAVDEEPGQEPSTALSEHRPDQAVEPNVSPVNPVAGGGT
ncbi:MAG: hypothetical protein WD341_09125 [Tistlia sp.]|uniref:hypothetical protein n=1 Tax=Tistlia sp. TaxID=3057121 RepID=UPI0034A14AEB